MLVFAIAIDLYAAIICLVNKGLSRSKLSAANPAYYFVDGYVELLLACSNIRCRSLGILVEPSAGDRFFARISPKGTVVS